MSERRDERAPAGEHRAPAALRLLDHAVSWTAPVCGGATLALTLAFMTGRSVWNVLIMRKRSMPRSPGPRI